MDGRLWKDRMRISVLICLAVLCYFLSKNAYMTIKNMKDVTTFQHIGSLTKEDYDEILRLESQAKNALEFILWSQSDNRPIEAVQTGQQQNVSCITVRGNINILFPNSQMLEDNDNDGCLIDRYTAKKLFKSTNVVGNTIKIDNTEYTVRGVMDVSGRTLVIQGNRDSKHTLSNITVKGVDNTEDFLTRHGLSSSITVKSSVYVSLSYIFYISPLFSIIWVILSILSSLKYKFKEYEVRRLTITILIVIVVSMGFLLFSTIIPQLLVPTQWSDFEFWREAATEFAYSMVSFVSSTKYRMDMELLYITLQSALGIICAHFIIVLYNKMKRFI